MNRSLVVMLVAVTVAGCHAEQTPIAEHAPTADAAAPSVAVEAAPVVATPPAAQGKRITEVRVVDDDRLWIVADGRAFESRDGARTFVDRTPFAREAAGSAREVESILTSPSRVFVLRGDDELATWMTLFASEDGGTSFVERRVPRLHGGRESRLQEGPTPGSLLVLRSDGGGMNSHATSILETRDAGVSFRELGTVTGYGAISFQTEATWWSVGSCCAGPSSIYRSSDHGLSWRISAAPTGKWEPISDLFLTGASHGYRVVRAGEGASLSIERTDDGGRSFKRAAPPSAATDLLGADRGACALGGEQGAVFATRDMGVSWSSLAPLPAGITAPRLSRAPHGWLAVASDGAAGSKLFVLRDGAAAWAELSPSWSERPGR